MKWLKTLSSVFMLQITINRIVLCHTSTPLKHNSCPTEHQKCGSTWLVIVCNLERYCGDAGMTFSLTSEHGEMQFTSAWLSFSDGCFAREGMSIMQLIWLLNFVNTALIFHRNWVLYFFSTPNILIALPTYVMRICLAVHKFFSPVRWYLAGFINFYIF